VQRHGTGGKLGLAALGLLAGSLALYYGLLFAREHELVGEASTSTIAGLSAMMSLLAPAVALVALVMRHWFLYLPGALAVKRDDLVITRGDRKRRISLARVAEGSLSPRRREIQLRLTSGDLVRARVDRVEDGQRLLEAAGLDASRRTLEMRLGETTFLDIVTVLLGVPAAWIGCIYVVEEMLRIREAPGWLATVAMIALVRAAVRAVRRVFGPARLVIGADGVVVRGRFRDRFVPHARIAAVEVAAQRIELRLDDGSTVRAKARHLTQEEQVELSTRLEDARRAFRAGAADQAALARLDRRGRAPAAWRDALRALLVDASGYREGSLSREDLLRVVESPAAPVERRIGAAVALSADGAPEDRARIRVAAEACANPRVRVALAQAASGEVEEAALEEAIAAERAAKVAK
jgi:hypothetical protein